MPDRIKLGIIGLGEVVQILHLPTLKKLHHQFEVTCVCDTSAETRIFVANHWGIENVVADPLSLLAQDNVEAVLIATPDVLHGKLARVAVEAGKYVMVEKPVAVTLMDAERLVTAEAASECVVQVGYMRNHSPVLQNLKSELQTFGQVNLVRVTDVIGTNKLITSQLGNIKRGSDIGEEQSENLESLRKQQFYDTLGVNHSADHALAFRILLGLGSHDFSAINYLFGQAWNINHASCSAGGKFIIVDLDYGSFICQLAIGVDNIPRYDTSIEIFTDTSVSKIVYDTPYVTHQPQFLHTLSVAQDRKGLSRQQQQFDWGDMFDNEWTSFFASVKHGKKVQNSVVNAYNDIRLIHSIMSLIQAE